MRCERGPLSLAMEEVLDDRAMPFELFAMGTGDGPCLCDAVVVLDWGRGDILAFAETRDDPVPPNGALLCQERIIHVSIFMLL